MTPLVELLVRGALLGVGGAVAMDGWALLLRRAFGIRGLDYGLLGRWVGHMPRGRFVHEAIVAARPIPGERAIGWMAHYGIAIGFAVIALLVTSTSLVRTILAGGALVYLVFAAWGCIEVLRIRRRPQALTRDALSPTDGLAEAAAAAEAMETSDIRSANFASGAARDLLVGGVFALAALVVVLVGGPTGRC